MAEQVTLDSTLIDSTNTQIILDDDANGIRLISHEYPDPGPTYMGASSADTEGSIPVQNQTQDRTISVVARCFGSSTMRARVKALQQKAGKFNREGGTLTRTLTDGTLIHFDVLSAKCVVPSDWVFANRTDVMVSLELLCKPVGYGPEFGPVSDNFSTDTITAGNYTFDSGTGTLSVSGGQLVPSSTALKHLLYTAAGGTIYDGQVGLKYTTGASTTSGVGVTVKRLDANNYLYVRISGSANQLSIIKQDGGSPTTLTSSSAFAVALATTTSYWIRLRIEGNLLTAEHWTSTPSLSGTPATTVTWTLTGADATKFGFGVSGTAGMRLTPPDTAWRYDDFTLEPNTYLEQTNPCLIATVTGIRGDQPARGRLVVTEVQGVDQWQTEYGLESRYYPGTATATTTAALFYEAGTRLLYGAAGTAVSGASGGSIVAGTVTTNYQALFSTASSGTVHATHIGDFRVKARVYCPANAGTVSYALQWGAGDLRSFTINDAVTYGPTAAATFRYLDLGLVHIPKVATGAQRWEGRVLAKSTTASDIAGVDCFSLFPVAEGYGVASGVAQSASTPTTFSARDEFNQTAGNLNTKTLPVGGAWATSGSTTDLATSGSGAVTRATTGDAGRRFAIAGSTAFTTVAVQADLDATSHTAAVEASIIARWTDSSNYLVLGFTPSVGNLATVALTQVVAGVSTTLYSTTGDGLPRTALLTVTSGGAWTIASAPTGETPTTIATGQTSVLATGGALASGKVGFADKNSTANASTRTYDNFAAWVPVTDAAVFADCTLEVRHNQTIREDSTGSYYQPVSSFDGTYLKIPPAGAEARSARFIVKSLRNDPDSSDTGIDDIAIQVFYTPRWLTVPET